MPSAQVRQILGVASQHFTFFCSSPVWFQEHCHITIRGNRTLFHCDHRLLYVHSAIYKCLEVFSFHLILKTHTPPKQNLSDLTNHGVPVRSTLLNPTGVIQTEEATQYPQETHYLVGEKKCITVSDTCKDTRAREVLWGIKGRGWVLNLVWPTQTDPDRLWISQGCFVY